MHPPTLPATASTSARKSCPPPSPGSRASSSTSWSTRSSARSSEPASTPSPSRRRPNSERGTHMSPSDNAISQAIESAISEHELILFMKGTPDQPRCGFSARTVAGLEALRTPFAAGDILPDPRIRQALSALPNWPTIPQLFHKGELVGGCDIVTEMYETGELAETLGVSGSGEAPEAVT